MKWILLTGATGGIGQAMAKALSNNGYSLILNARDEKRLKSVIASLKGENRILNADISTNEGRKKIDTFLDEKQIKLDKVIFNAGINDFSLFSNQNSSAIINQLELNLLSPILLTQLLIPHLAEKAHLVYIGSTFGAIGFPGYASYCASKSGLRGFAQAMGRELSDQHINVSYFAPRATDTEMNTEKVVSMNKELGSHMDKPEVVANELLKLIKSPVPEKFIGYPEKIFARLNGLLPKFVGNQIIKNLNTIKLFASK